MKHQVLFSLKNNEKIFMNVVCCSRDWYFKVNKSLTNNPVNPFALSFGRFECNRVKLKKL